MSRRVVCPICDARMMTQKSLAEHAAKEHHEEGAEFKLQRKLFNSRSDFEQWMHLISVQTGEYFCVESRRPNTIYLRCSRSGRTRSTETGKRIACRTRKVQTHCTSFMTVRQEANGAVSAEFVLDHLGHANGCIGEQRHLQRDAAHIQRLSTEGNLVGLRTVPSGLELREPEQIALSMPLMDNLKCEGPSQRVQFGGNKDRLKNSCAPSERVESDHMNLEFFREVSGDEEPKSQILESQHISKRRYSQRANLPSVGVHDDDEVMTSNWQQIANVVESCGKVERTIETLAQPSISENTERQNGHVIAPSQLSDRGGEQEVGSFAEENRKRQRANSMTEQLCAEGACSGVAEVLSGLSTSDYNDTNGGEENDLNVVGDGRFVLVEVERLIKLVRRCASCGLLVRNVALSYDGAVPILTWGCTGDCAPSGMEVEKKACPNGVTPHEGSAGSEGGSGDARNVPDQHNTVVEGSAKITFCGPSSAFYNPVQEFNRDLTVTVLQQFCEDYRKDLDGRKAGDDSGEPPAKKAKQVQLEEARDGTIRILDALSASGLRAIRFAKEDGTIRILDALSASGLRAIRFAKEVPFVAKVLANDFSEQAVETINKNIAVNGVQNIVQSRFGDAVTAMMDHRSIDKRFHAIDLDPYGSASVFLDSAVQAVADRGILMITCTDTAVLCGNTPEACYNKYGSVALRHKCSHEFAIRVLLKSVDSHANRYARYIEPLLSISVDFYVRVFVRVHTSAKLAKDSVTKVSHVLACTGCHSLQLQPLARKSIAGASIKFSAAIFSASLLDAGGKCVHCGQSVHIGGPIYSAPIHDFNFVNKLIKRLKENPEEKRPKTYERLLGLLSVVSEELPDVPLHYEHDQLMHVVKSPVPRLMNVRSAILNAGFRCSIVHCNPRAIKTDAPVSLLWDIARTVAKSNNIPVSRFDENSPGRKIIEGAITHEINFQMHPDAQSKSKADSLLRFQCNKGKNWGPKAKAKGSVNSVKAGFQMQTAEENRSKTS
ncbi:tRNA (guanine(26)-N(2))-dimethyltransferase [Toxocara canis]|uniref:tRNA (guanine(26)-N(2))-dimethyltransferase n=1 Tax=Toxocara canis TaxID=6265 RepID=A0A0B2VG93_TOXCA|nr:tRNA (guanine(26)-N(2))-dimethyltransferase [Toxocara canis]